MKKWYNWFFAFKIVTEEKDATYIREGDMSIDIFSTNGELTPELIKSLKANILEDTSMKMKNSSTVVITFILRLNEITDREIQP